MSPRRAAPPAHTQSPLVTVACCLLLPLAAACAPAPPVVAPAPLPSASTPSPSPAPPEPAQPALSRRSAGLQVVFDLHKSPVPNAMGENAVRLQPMDGRTFVSIGDVLFYVDGDILRTDPALRRGLSDLPRPNMLAVELGAMGGHWPDGAFVQVTRRGERLFQSEYLRWGGQEWRAGIPGSSDLATRILPLPNGWSLAVLANPWSHLTDFPMRKAAALLHPRWGRLVTVRAPIESAATLPDGSLVAAGDGRVWRWGPDGEPAPMPSPEYRTGNRTPVTSEIVALSPTDIYLLDIRNDKLGEHMDLPSTPDPPRPERALLRFDGRRWAVEPTPAARPDRIFAGPRGALWVGQDSTLYERAADGTWAELTVPAPLDRVWASPSGDVWATSGGTLLLHTRPLPDGVDLARLTPPGEITRFSDDCASLTALLDEVPRTAPPDLDFHAQLAAVRPALGKLAPAFSFYDVMVAGKRRLAVHLPALSAVDAPLARRVGAALIAQAEARGAPRPRLVCVELPAGIPGARLLRGPMGK